MELVSPCEVVGERRGNNKSAAIILHLLWHVSDENGKKGRICRGFKASGVVA